MTTSSEFWQKLTSGSDYRKEIVSSLLKRGTALQIQGMMKERGWTQAQLAEHAGLTQGVVSRASNPAYGNLTFNTVIEIAAGFDVAFIGKFVPFTELAKWVGGLPEEISFRIPSFEQENANIADRGSRTASEFALISSLAQQSASAGNEYPAFFNEALRGASQEPIVIANPMEQASQEAGGASQHSIPLAPAPSGMYEPLISRIHLVQREGVLDQPIERKKTHRPMRRKGFLKRSPFARQLSA